MTKKTGRLKQSLRDLMQDLAMQLAVTARVSKRMTINVAGAADDAAAKNIALAIGNSPW